MSARASAVDCLAVGAAFMALLVAGAAPSQAASGGLTYVHSKFRKLPSRQQAAATANCPEGTSVVGGGLAIQGGNTATGMASSSPNDDGDANSRPEDGWTTVANSRSAADKRIAAIGICSRSGQYRYVQSLPLTLAIGDQDGPWAACPANQPVIGGGVELSGHSTVLTLRESVPWDSMDGGNVPDEGWYTAANNESGSPQAVIAEAVCARSGSFQYVARQEAVPTGTQGGVAVPCPAGTRVTAGGANTGTSSTAAEVAQSHSYNDDGPRSPPDDGWQANVNNESGSETTMETWAVCRG